jgi:hypothetical protein
MARTMKELGLFEAQGSQSQGLPMFAYPSTNMTDTHQL